MYMNTIYAVKVPALLLQYILPYVYSVTGSAQSTTTCSIQQKRARAHTVCII